MKFLIPLFLFTCIVSSAQISDYSHPPTILGQEKVSIDMNSSIAVRPEMFIIHDMEGEDFSTHEIILSSGENYTISGTTISPANGFSGVLNIGVTVSDGEHQSDMYTFKIKVNAPGPELAYEIARQKNTQIKKGETLILSPDKLTLHKLLASNQATFYVSPNGDDTNSGTKTQALKTLEGARKKVKNYKETIGTPGSGITVFFREGDYYMSNTVNFDDSDSGEEDKYITYRAYPNEKVRFTGSKQIETTWFTTPPASITSKIKNTEARNKIVMVDLGAHGIASFGSINHVGYGVRKYPKFSPPNIYVGGKAMHLCRYPNKGHIDDVTLPEGKKSYQSVSGIVNTWENTGDLWIDGPLSEAWEWRKNKISTISEDGRVTTAYAYTSDIKDEHPAMFYFNMIEELDSPEEYFMDRKNGILYFYPPENIDNQEIRISQSTSTMLELNGCKYVRFVDLVFEGTRSTAIELTNNAIGNEFINCEIHSVGMNGIHINGYDNKVISSHIHDIGAGNYISGGDAIDLTPARNLIENCKIHDFSQEIKAYNPGLSVFGIGQVIRHVELFNGPHMAMRIKGTNHVIEYCDIHHAPHEYSDMLAVYMNTGYSPLDRGTTIRKNKFHDVSGTWKQSAGVYLDNETSGVLVEKNYFFDNVAESGGWSVMFHGGCDNICRQNIFAYTSYPFNVSYRLNGYVSQDFEKWLNRWQSVFERSATPAYFKYFPELKHFFDDNGVTPDPMTMKFDIKKDAEGNVTNYYDRRTPSTNVFTDNLIYNESPDIFEIGLKREYYSLSYFREIDGVMQENLISGNNHNLNKDPGFVDYKNRDLSFSEDSIDPGVKADLPFLSKLPFNEMGLKDKVGVQYVDCLVDPSLVSIIHVANTNTENYTINDNVIMPKSGFTGILNIPIKVKVGSAWESDMFEFKVYVD